VTTIVSDKHHIGSLHACARSRLTHARVTFCVVRVSGAEIVHLCVNTQIRTVAVLVCCIVCMCACQSLYGDRYSGHRTTRQNESRLHRVTAPVAYVHCNHSRACCIMGKRFSARRCHRLIESIVRHGSTLSAFVQCYCMHVWSAYDIVATCGMHIVYIHGVCVRGCDVHMHELRYVTIAYRALRAAHSTCFVD
jgi:hypothetical protein